MNTRKYSTLKINAKSQNSYCIKINGEHVDYVERFQYVVPLLSSAGGFSMDSDNRLIIIIRDLLCAH